MITNPRPREGVVVAAPAGEAPRSPRRIRWARRRRAILGFWRIYSQSRMGMVDLVMMLAFILTALAAPLFVSPEDLSVSTPRGLPFEPPSREFWLGTDNFGRSVLDLVIYGSRISLLVGFAATAVTMVLGTAIGIAGGYKGGWIDSLLNAFTNWFLVIPWIALAIVLTAILGRLSSTHPRDRYHLLGGDRSTRAGRCPFGEATTLRRARSGPRRQRLAPRDRHVLPNVMPVIFANTVLTVALVDPRRNDARAARARRSSSISWGGIIFNAFDAGALSAGLLVVADPAGRLHLPRHARVHDVRLCTRRSAQSEDP